MSKPPEIERLIAAALNLAETHDWAMDQEFGDGGDPIRTPEAEAVRAAVAALRGGDHAQEAV